MSPCRKGKCIHEVEKDAGGDAKEKKKERENKDEPPNDGLVQPEVQNLVQAIVQSSAQALLKSLPQSQAPVQTLNHAQEASPAAEQVPPQPAPGQPGPQIVGPVPEKAVDQTPSHPPQAPAQVAQLSGQATVEAPIQVAEQTSAHPQPTAPSPSAVMQNAVAERSLPVTVSSLVGAVADASEPPPASSSQDSSFLVRPQLSVVSIVVGPSFDERVVSERQKKKKKVIQSLDSSAGNFSQSSSESAPSKLFNLTFSQGSSNFQVPRFDSDEPESSMAFPPYELISGIIGSAADELSAFSPEVTQSLIFPIHGALDTPLSATSFDLSPSLRVSEFQAADDLPIKLSRPLVRGPLSQKLDDHDGIEPNPDGEARNSGKQKVSGPLSLNRQSKERESKPAAQAREDVVGTKPRRRFTSLQTGGESADESSDAPVEPAKKGKFIPMAIASVVVVLVLGFAVTTMSGGLSGSRQNSGLNSQQLHPSVRHLAAPEIQGWWKITMWVNEGKGDVEASRFTTKIDQNHTNLSGGGKDEKGTFTIEGKIELGQKNALLFTKTYDPSKSGEDQPPINYEGAIQNGESASIASGVYYMHKTRTSALSRLGAVRGTWAAEPTSAPNFFEQIMSNKSSSAQSNINPFIIILALVVGMVVMAFMMKNRPQRTERAKIPSDDDN